MNQTHLSTAQLAWLQALEAKQQKLELQFKQLEIRTSQQIEHLNHFSDRSQLTTISLIEYLAKNGSLNLDEFEKVVDQVDALDGSIDGKTSGKLDYGTFQQRIEEATQKLDPRIAKLLFLGKNKLINQKAKELD